MNALLLMLTWLGTYFVHSSVILSMAWLAQRLHWVRGRSATEWMWRCALLAGIATASVWVLMPVLVEGSGASAIGLPGEIRALSPGTVSLSAPLPSPQAVEAAVGERMPPTFHPLANAAPPATHANEEFARESARRAHPGIWQLDAPASFGKSATWIVLIWMIVSLVRVALSGRRFLRGRRRVAGLLACADPRVLACVRQVCTARGLRAPHIVSDPDSRSPSANPGGVLVLPHWVLKERNTSKLEAMLSHEIGHIARHDLKWRCASMLVRQIFWFQPLNRLAAARIESLAEFGADAWAVGVTGNRRALAQSLAQCVRALGNLPPELTPGFAMVGRASVLNRVEHILEEHPMKKNPRLLQWLLLAAGSIAVIALLPVVAISRGTDGHRTLIESLSAPFSQTRTRITIEDGAFDLKADLRGDIRFSAGEDDIVGMGNDGSARIEQKIDGVVHRIDFAQVGQRVTRSYRRDGHTQAFDAQARAWLAAAIPTLLRESAFDVEARMQRIHQRLGFAGAALEIDRVRGEYARRRHVEAIATLGAMEPVELQRILTLASRIRSDFERREAFVALVARQHFQPVQQLALLRLVASMQSDFEQRTVLVALAPTLSDQPRIAAAWAATLDQLDSDFERREALAAVAGHSSVPPSLIAAAFESMGKMHSDFEKRSALESYSGRFQGNPSLTRAYAAVVRGMSSDFERRQALSALLQRRSDVATAEAVLGVVAEMHSDFEKREVLVQLATHMPDSAELIESYRSVARGLSDYERMQAEKALDRFAG